MQETILSAKNLTKKYGSFTALENVDITVYKGDIFGLIGRNGAGKTTLLKILSGLTNCTSGEYSVFSKSGEDLRKQRRRIGCLIEEPAFFKNMTARQNLKYYCLQKGITDLSQIDKVLETISLTDSGNKKFKDFSMGMKQRLGIAFALLDKGKVIKDLTKDELDAECTLCTVLRTDNVNRAVTLLEDKLGVTEFDVTDKEEIRITQPEIKPMLITKTLVENGIGVGAIYESGLSLEDYFKKILSSN